MAKRKQRIGKIPCPLCGTECVVKADEGDEQNTLNYVCHMGCDAPNYAPAGTVAHRLVLQKMTRDQEKKPAAPAAQEKPAAKPAAAPAPKQQPAKIGFFS